MHVQRQTIHGYQNRAVDVRVSVTTDEDTGDFSDVTFRFSDVEKTITPSDTAAGFDADFTLTAADLSSVGVFRWELLATLAGEVRTVGQGIVAVDAEPTSGESS